METKVGAVVLATDQGLGYLARDFFNHGIIHKVFIHPHASRHNHWNWYPRSAVVSTPEELLDCDTILFIEEPFYWKLIPQAREKGTKTVLIPMYECTRNPLPYQPDLIISPSLLDQEYYPDSVSITIPVNVHHKLRTTARCFVHNAGNGGLGGRNGTNELLKAIPLVKSPSKFLIRSQVPIRTIDDPRVEFRVGTFEDIWSEGDVFVFPEKFNGLSLPIQEAFASGLLVMCGDRFPMNTWLPREPLIPVDSYKEEKLAVKFKSAQLSPTKIAEKIDEWYDKDITQFSLLGKEWGEKHSWNKLKKRYMELLSR